MAIELSTITFTNGSDVVSRSGAEQISVSRTVNTLGGDDIINGANEEIPNRYTYSFFNDSTLNTNDGNDIITGIFTPNESLYFKNTGGISNAGSPENIEGEIATINTGDGNDTITGIIRELSNPYLSFNGSGIKNAKGIIDMGEGDDVITGIGDYGIGIHNEPGTIDTGAGNDIITGISKKSYGIDSRFGNIITGDDNDTIMGTGGSGLGIIFLSGNLDTGEGNDIINGTSDEGGILFGTSDFSVDPSIDTGEGDDIITGTGGSGNGIENIATVNTSNGKDSIISHGKFINFRMFLGDGDDFIIANIDFPGRAIENYQMIDTGYGKDIITSTGAIYNEGVINTGDGADSIIVEGGINDITGTTYGIYNNGGAIITGNGNDSIIASEGFESSPNSSGSVFLGEGEDYIKGFGSGDFYGGNGNDTLELTSGTYTVGIWGGGNESPIFTKGNQLMITSEFEKLKAGSTIYDFISLTAGQIIVVA
jgi:hypothetical protein